MVSPYCLNLPLKCQKYFIYSYLASLHEQFIFFVYFDDFNNYIPHIGSLCILQIKFHYLFATNIFSFLFLIPFVLTISHIL